MKIECNSPNYKELFRNLKIENESLLCKVEDLTAQLDKKQKNEKIIEDLQSKVGSLCTGGITHFLSISLPMTFFNSVILM